MSTKVLGGQRRTADGRQNMVERGFSDMQITAGKGGGYIGETVGPNQPYYADLARQEPPLDRLCPEDIARRSLPREGK